jgi:oligopeptide/dipeptide ABC transporter ATP-binding protein
VSRGPLLRLRALDVRFRSEEGDARAVDGVDLDVRAGETVGLVGESGSGKSVTALAVLGLVPAPGTVAGEVFYEGRDLQKLGPEARRGLRGREIAMVFQEPLTALNPVLSIGEQVAEPLRLPHGLDRSAARARAIELWREVGIPDPETRVDEFPHRLSGGMRQRVMIAMAIACSPKLLIADEPTTALDVTVQAQILDLLGRLQQKTGLAVLLITHVLAGVAERADRVAGMYAGRVVETADVTSLFARPQHPYTLGLMRSLPQLARRGEPLAAIPGVAPSPRALPPGCRFHPRCSFATELCRERTPPLEEAPAEGGGAGEPRRVACHHWRAVGEHAREVLAP